jgi:hypothetical protein
MTPFLILLGILAIVGVVLYIKRQDSTTSGGTGGSGNGNQTPPKPPSA